MADPLETHYSPACYHTKFDRPRSNPFDVGGVPKNSGDTGAAPNDGAWKPYRNMLLSHLYYHDLSIILGQTILT